MRRLIIGSLTVLLAGCNLNAPSGVKVILNSDKILDVQKFEYDSSGIGGVSYYCSVSGSIKYDITFEPSNFTGAVSLNNLVLEYAGKWRSEPQTVYLDVLDGKLVNGTGINITESSNSDDPKDKKEAVCASKSSSDIKIASLGEPVLVFPGLKASTKIVSGTNAAP